MKPLAASALSRRIDPDILGFRATDEVPDLDQVVGQDRAVSALAFAVGIQRDGYNVFALGPPGCGKHGIVQEFLARIAARAPVPQDWCYVSDFAQPHRPRALPLPAGRGAALRADLDRLIADLRAALPAAFAGDGYRSRKRAIEAASAARQEAELGEVERAAAERSVALARTPTGFSLARLRDGQPLEQGAFDQLPPAEQAGIQADLERIREMVQEVFSRAPERAREQREQLGALQRETTQGVVDQLLVPVRERYADLPAVTGHLEAMERDLVANAADLLQVFAQPEQEEEDLPTVSEAPDEVGGLSRYRANVIADRSGQRGAPVVYEDDPALANLVGRSEHISYLGTLISDFTLIRGGALHRANGGYLVLDARKLLLQPLSWEALKRALRSREIRLPAPVEAAGAPLIVSLEPEPVPLAVKVVLVGERPLYDALFEQDPDFEGLFKVPADFEDQMALTPENLGLYARLVATHARREGLRPLEAGAVARVIEHGLRVAEDNARLTTQFRYILDLLAEADHWAGARGATVSAAEDVEKAIQAKDARAGRPRDRLQEEIARGVLRLETSGAIVGQVNGLSISVLGSFSFGQPCRITARVRPGRGEVIDIERQVDLGGPVHSKGVLILSGFLGGRYAADRPLSLSATLVFEQSYGGIDGDSASSAELYALLSALADVPLRQSLAVTGSVDQRGQVQAVGGINQKIEGFFDTCARAGLTGEHGVLIPAANAQHLMLRRDVVAAAERGLFAVYPVSHIDEGLALLTGLPAGEPLPGGGFPEGSVNARVEARLLGFAEARRRFAAP